jgi:hypothetical protein
MVRILVLLPSVFVALGVTVSCSDTPAAPAFEPCPGDTVTMEVVAGLTPPTFRWSPRCGVSFLEVYPEAGGSALWTVYADSGRGPENPIASGVQYGVTPARAQTVGGPEPLLSGIAYTVRVSRLLCEQGVLCILSDAGHVNFQR